VFVLLASCGSGVAKVASKSDAPKRKGYTPLSAPSNLDFEICDGRDRVPQDWFHVGQGTNYTVGCDSKSLEGQWSAHFSNHVGTGGFGGVGQCVSAETVRGSKMHLKGSLLTADVASGYAGLWARVDDANGNVLAFDNMSNRGVTGSSEWKQYDIDLQVLNTADKICFGAILTGVGDAYVDQLTMTFSAQ